MEGSVPFEKRDERRVLSCEHPEGQRQEVDELPGLGLVEQWTMCWGASVSVPLQLMSAYPLPAPLQVARHVAEVEEIRETVVDQLFQQRLLREEPGKVPKHHHQQRPVIDKHLSLC